jgi:hypothetical protein
MPGQPSQPVAKGDWPASKQAIVIGGCILSVVILVIAAILGAAPSSGAAPASGEHGHANGDSDQDGEG